MASVAVQKNVTNNAVNQDVAVLGKKNIFYVAGNRVFRVEPLPRGKMADIPLQKSKSGLTSGDVLDYLREEKC